MGRLLQFLRPKASLENPNTPLTGAALLEAFGGGATDAGVAVNPTTAMASTAVMACVNLLSDTVASLPLVVYERTEDGRDDAREHPIHRLLHGEPNAWMTSFTFIQYLMGQTLTRGNGYAVIGRTVGSAPLELLPLPSQNVQVSRVDGRLKYEIRLDSGQSEILDQANVLHIPGLGFDGITGTSPISAARSAIGVALAADQHSAKVFGNGAYPAGKVETDGQISADALKNLQKSYTALYSGTANAAKTMFLDSGMKWSPVTLSPADLELLQVRRFQIAEIARIYRVPLHMIGEQEKTTSWGTGIEQQTIGFVQYSLRPWLVRFEQEINRKLLGGDFYAEFVVEGLLRGDSKARAEFYQSGIQNRWLLPNEVRRIENLPPVDGGDEFADQQTLAKQAGANPETDDDPLT